MQEEVAKEFGVPVQFQRFWLWAKRQNHTYRPNRPLTHLEETQTVSKFCSLFSGAMVSRALLYPIVFHVFYLNFPHLVLHAFLIFLIIVR